MCFRPSISVSIDSGTAFLLWVRIITGALLNGFFRLFLLWSLLFQTLGVNLWCWGSQHNCIGGENLKRSALSMRRWRTWWFVESQCVLLVPSNGSAAPQASAASVHIARSGDVSWQNRTKSKQKWIKPMSEALSGLWIRSRKRLWCGGIPLEQEGAASFTPLHHENSWGIVNLLLFASLWGKWKAEFQENESFANLKLLETIFTACQKGDQLVFRAGMFVKRYPEPFQRLVPAWRTCSSIEKHKKSPWISLARCLWNPPHFKWISPSSTECTLLPPRCDHYPLLLQSHGQNTEENILQSFGNEWFLRLTVFCFVVAGSPCLEVVIICPR